MTDEQRLHLGDLNFSLITKTTDEMLVIKSIIDQEIDQRLAIESKEKAITLAEKVQNATGKDQSIDKLKSELHKARKDYAAWVTATPLYNYDENRLQPIVSVRPKPAFTDRPVWEITEDMEDGTRRHLGYSYGEPGYEPELPTFKPTENSND